MKSFLLAIPVMLVVACGSAGTQTNGKDSGQSKKTETVQKHGAPIPVDSSLTSFARFISGMDYPKAVKTTEKKSWKSFASGTNEKWTVLDQKIGSKISGWLTENPQGQATEPNTLFYPFAGGDFYYASLFFPKQDTIIMVGLEPGGSVFDPTKYSDSTMMSYYNNLGHTMFFPHKLGFFRTKSMANDFHRGPLNGTLHTVLFYISRFGYNIHYIQHFNLSEDGKETELTASSELKKKNKYIGYKVGYSLPGSKEVKEVIYLSFDASDGYLAKHPAMMKWLDQRGKMVTFFKAASYLMYESYFSTIRNFVLKKSVRVFQDDSGLPYKVLKDNNFNVTLLGTYTRTIALFAHQFQPEMKKAYAETKPKKLPFMIGYNAEFNECNLQSAVKK